MWLNLGIAGLPHGYGERFVKDIFRDSLEKLMTPTQLAEAQPSRVGVMAAALMAYLHRSIFAAGARRV